MPDQRGPLQREIGLNGGLRHAGLIAVRVEGSAEGVKGELSTRDPDKDRQVRGRDLEQHGQLLGERSRRATLAGLGFAQGADRTMQVDGELVPSQME